MEITIEIQGKNYTFPSETTAKEVSEKLQIPAIVCRVNGKLTDLNTKLKSCRLDLLDFDDAKDVFWHSSAHILGCALTRLFDCKLLSGPPTESGFFYDVEFRPFTPEDISKIENEMRRIVKEGIDFQRTMHSKEDLLQIFKDNPHKIKYIEKYVSTQSTCYSIGDWRDFCEGPHIPNTSLVRTLKITSNGSIVHPEYPQGSFQRISGISFPSEERMQEYEKFITIAKSLDHRRIGVEHELFFFHELSPGSCFFLPKGAYIYNALVEFLRELYRKNGYNEVVSPNIYQTRLWVISGHLQNYKENMFMIEDFETDIDMPSTHIDSQQENNKSDPSSQLETDHKNNPIPQTIKYALKPMNCPGHCLMYKFAERSFRDLPLRFADFGVLHRNELRGALSGLTRVRRFQQDDAHIFCRNDQIEEEIRGCLNFLRQVYEIFNFTFSVCLSTRPSKFIGTIEEWDLAETKLKAALSGFNYKINEGDGAFYGPKIDITLRDAFRREIQCGTIQLDFQLPLRFDLRFKASTGYERPVIIHRAVLGSIERFIAILLESFGKHLPFWLSPNQIAIVRMLPKDESLHASYETFFSSLLNRLKGFEVVVLNEQLSVNKRVLMAEKEGYNFIIFVGAKELKENCVDVRGSGLMNVDEFVNMLEEKKRKREI